MLKYSKNIPLAGVLAKAGERLLIPIKSESESAVIITVDVTVV